MCESRFVGKSLQNVPNQLEDVSYKPAIVEEGTAQLAFLINIT